MDRLDAATVFVAVAELGGFAAGGRFERSGHVPPLHKLLFCEPSSAAGTLRRRPPRGQHQTNLTGASK
jgi:hypothetical protein